MSDHEDDDAVDFSEEDFHYSSEHDISDIKITPFRNKKLTKITLEMCSTEGRSIDIMRWYLAISAYKFKIEQEIGVLEECPIDQ